MTLPLRRNARFQLLWIGSAASTLGSQTVQLAYPLLVLAVTNSPVQAGLVGAAQLVGMLMVAVPAGPLIDRWDRRRILVGCEAVRAAGVASVAAAVLLDRVTVPHLMAVAWTLGGAGALFTPARLTAVRAVVPPDQLRPALAQEEARGYAAALAGPPLGGFLYGVARALPFVVDAVSYVVSLVCVLAARVPRRPAEATRADGIAGQLAEGLRWMWARPFLRAVAGFSLAVNLATTALALPVIVLIVDRGGSSTVVGVALAMMGAGGLVGTLVAARIGRMLPPGRLALAVGWLLAVLLPLTTLPLGPLWPGLVLATVMVVLPAANVSLQATMLAGIPDGLQGRIGSLLMLSSLGIAPVGSMLGGYLTEKLGPVPSLGLLGLLLAAFSAVATVTPTLRAGAGPVSDSIGSANRLARTAAPAE
ncbi:MAG TPA: MFS transporter [Micromonosporaceae bacterium]|nr:MFS transporter [Micromonosporaceae bacterium]